MGKLILKIKSHPVSTGIAIAFIFFGLVLISLTWFPSVLDAWLRNNALVRSVYLTAVLYVVFIVFLRRERRRNPSVFWVSISVFFAIHIAFVSFYTIRLHPIRVSEWIVIMVMESVITVGFLTWAIRKAGGPQN